MRALPQNNSFIVNIWIQFLNKNVFPLYKFSDIIHWIHMFRLNQQCHCMTCLLVHHVSKPRQGVDIQSDGYIHNLLTDGGFLYAVRQVLRIKEGGLAFWALPCNSYSFMSFANHNRTASQPFGDLKHAFVHVGNILGTRMVLLLMLAACRSVHYFVENPENSAVRIFPYLMHMMAIPELNPNRTQWCPLHVLYEVLIQLLTINV